MSRTAHSAQHKLNCTRLFATAIFFSIFLFSGSVCAGNWKLFCPVGSSCNVPYQLDLGGNGLNSWCESESVVTTPTWYGPQFLSLKNSTALTLPPVALGNHRYVTTPALLTDIQPEGCIDEGIAICTPNPQSGRTILAKFFDAVEGPVITQRFKHEVGFTFAIALRSSK